MEIFSPRMRQAAVEPRPRGTFTSAMPLLRNSGMTLLAMLLAVTFARLVCG